MGGECYRYCRLVPNVTITEKEEKIYQELLMALIPEIKSWLVEEDPNDWVAIFDGGCRLSCSLQVEQREYLKGEIILPKQLNHSLEVGWQHRCYGSIRDLKKYIATKIMDTLMESDLRTLIEDLEEDNIACDLGMDDGYIFESEEQSKGPLHKSYMDNSWSPNGLYGGYDDWETYRDANGLD